MTDLKKDPNAGVHDPHSGSAATTKTALADAADAQEHPTAKENQRAVLDEQVSREGDEREIGQTAANGVLEGAQQPDEYAAQVARDNRTINTDNNVDNPYLNEAKLAEDRTHPVPTQAQREERKPDDTSLPNPHAPDTVAGKVGSPAPRGTKPIV